MIIPSMSGVCCLFHLVQCNTSHKLGGSFRQMVQTQLTQVMKDLKPRKEQLKGVQVADVGFVVQLQISSDTVDSQ